MIITVIADIVNYERTVIVEDGLEFEVQVTEEEFDRIVESIMSEKYYSMDADANLKDICDRCTALVNEFSADVFEDIKYGDCPREFVYLFEYPVEALKEAVGRAKRYVLRTDEDGFINLEFL